MTGAAGSGGLSGHPADVLIRELIRTRRAATPDEIAQIFERMATAPFDSRVRRVPVEERGGAYRGVVLGARAESLTYHLVKRVVVEEQWGNGTTPQVYLADLRRAVHSPDARLVVYAERGGHIAATITPTAKVVPRQRQGLQSFPNLLVIYSADRCIIVTGYQFSTLGNARIPQEALWLR